MNAEHRIRLIRVIEKIEKNPKFSKKIGIKDKTKEKLISLYPKVLVTPHIGSYTDEALTNMIEYSYENLREYLNDRTCKNSIA